MDYTQKIKKGDCTMLLEGELTYKDHQKFNDILNTIRGDKIKTVTLELAEVNYVDSAGLGMFLLALEESKKNFIKLTLNNPTGQVRELFTISSFSSLFEINSK